MKAADKTRRAKKKTPKILLTYVSPQPFAERDREILGKHFKVQSYQFNGKKSVPRMAVLVARNNLNLSWFTLGNATSCVILSKIFRKKSLVIAGGWDVVYLPEIDYGAMKHPTRIRRTTYALREADRVIAVSQSTKNEVLNWVEREVEVIYNGVDTEKFIRRGEKENLVMTVAGIKNSVRYKTKGMETLLKAAAKMPDVNFAIIGDNSPDWNRKMHELAADNTTIVGRKIGEELLSYYQRAKAYAQISFHESFGVALAEAMSCGCVPVATNRFALPEVVGDTGFYVDYGDVDGTVEAIWKALDSPNEEKCRKRITDNFSIQIREKKLVELVNDVLNE